ncbi:hypothetical protein FVE85_3374 [Porphyridium purpureum]|uniref:Sucrose phosphatase-like domain-containing protein n=1 Tax=Porphyridium purpureum TaxID=35688 RepID=A0A5J4YWN8_PORPP|nr:hypothetical protein FVE85_3374 [Porphyridium purpureum]|eukprot:POR6050..scf227_4
MVRVVFSDLDGTLVHYEKEWTGYAHVVSQNESLRTLTLKYKDTGDTFECALMPASGTTPAACISLNTLALVQRLRESDVKFVIITGARSSTFAVRRAALPLADYEFCENGGRMLKGGALDANWTATRYAAEIGAATYVPQELVPSSENAPPPERREGTLWDAYRVFAARPGEWKLDTRDYYTSFRVDVAASPGKTEQDLRNVLAQFNGALSMSFNLGKADVYPSSSGKRNAAAYVLEVERIAAADSVAIFDDDNDIELGELVGRGFLPGVTHASVKQAAARNPHWTITSSPGPRGTEEALRAVLALVEAKAAVAA